jgi:hypothetical protein
MATSKPSSQGKKKSANTESGSKKAQQLVTDRFDRARNYRTTTQEDVWDRSYNNWRGVLDSSLYPWRSKLFIPWSFTVVETIIPRVFARDPKWRAISREPMPTLPTEEPVHFNGITQSTPDQASVVNNLLTYQWDRMGMRLKMYDYIKDSLMFAKGYAKVGWCFQMKNKSYMEPLVGKDDVITFEKKTKSEVEYDDPKIDIVDPYDIYVDPDATSLDDAAYLIHRKTVPLAEVKDNPNYQNVDKIKENDYADQYMDKLSRYNDGVPQKDKHKNLVEILEYWGADDRLVVVANRGVVLRDTPNPYNHKKIPFIELDDYRDPHNYYGQSELSVIDPLQREVNSIRNQRRDYDNLALNPVIQMVPGTLRNPNSAVMAPGSVWMVSDLNSIGTFQLPPLQGAASEIEDRTAQDIKMSVAIDEIGIGLLPENPQRRSATEVVTSQQSAGKRFSVKIALLEEAVKKMGQMVFALDQQFLSEERTIQIVGERGAQEWIKLGPDDVRGGFFIDIETGSMLPRDEIAQRQEATQLLQYITPIISPIIQSNPGIIMPVIRMVLDTFELPGIPGIIKDFEQALGVASERQQEQQQLQQQLQQAQQAKAEAGAVAQFQQAVQPPETAQGNRADLELQAASNAG